MAQRTPRKETIPKWKKKAWSIFSKLIRLRDCLENDDSGDYAKCVTCGKVYHFKQLQAGHFLPGRRNSILFDERGVHAQCSHCNIQLRGNWVRYLEFMKDRYGQDVIDELIEQDKTVVKFTVDQLKDMYHDYRSRFVAMGGVP